MPAPSHRTPAIFPVTRVLGTLLALLSLAPAEIGRAEGRAIGDVVEVSPTTTEPLAAAPGEVVTAIFTVTNTGTETRSFKASADLPAGWRRIGSSNSFDVSGGDTVRRLISFRVSADAPVGSFDIRYRVTDVGAPLVFDSGVVTVAVGESDRFDITLLRAPSWVVSGDDYQIALVLSNRGNATRHIRLLAKITPETTFDMSLDELTVFEPGERQTLRVDIRATQATQRKQRQWLRLHVTSDGVVLNEIAVPVDVLPTGGYADRAGRMPASVTLHSFTGHRGSGAQVEFDAHGPLRNGGTDIIEVGIRTPDRSTASLFARRDEYRVAYVSKSWAVMLGDHAFSLSPLTEYGRRGRGVGASATAGALTATAFFSRGRYALPREDVVGVGLKYSLSDALRFGANFLDKSGFLPGESITIRSEFEPIRDVKLDLELGDGGDSGVRSSAFAAGVSGSRKFGSIDARYMKTGRAFPGLYPDRTVASMSFSARPTRNVRFDASASTDERRLQFASAAGSIVQSKYVRGGPTYKFEFLRSKVNLSAAYKYRAQNADFGSAGENRNHLSTELTADIEIGRYSLGASVEHGSVYASFVGERRAASRYELATRARYRSFSWNVAASFDRGAAMYRLEGQETALISVGANGNIGSSFAWGVDAFAMFDRSFIARQYRSVATRATYQLPFGHHVGVRAQVTAIGVGGGLYGHDVGVTYRVPFSIPTLRKSEMRIRGRVVDAETGEGVTDALVRVGKRTGQTREDGRFTVPIAGTETEYLLLDGASVGLDRVPLIEMPMAVSDDVIASEIEIPVAVAGSISGIVNRFVFENGALQTGSLTASAPEPGVVIEFSDGIGRIRTTSSVDGTFRAPRIRPGTWTVRIVYASLPETYGVGEPVTVHVAPGQRVDIELKTVPRRRQIRFVASGRLSADSVEAKPASPVEPVEETGLPGNDLASGEIGGQTQLAHAPITLDGCPITAELPLQHEVLPGETLTGLAATYYCSASSWPIVWFGNDDALPNPHRLEPGDNLVVPAVGAALGFEPDAATGPARRHVVAAGETLKSIASDYYGHERYWPRIWMANTLVVGDGVDVPAGAVLVVPGSEWHRFERLILRRKP